MFPVDERETWLAVDLQERREISLKIHRYGTINIANFAGLTVRNIENVGLAALLVLVGGHGRVSLDDDLRSVTQSN